MLVIALRLAWFPCPGGRGAIRVRDHAFWSTAIWCKACICLGYDHGDIDAVLEAHRLGVDHAPHITGGVCTACARRAGA